MFPPFRLHFGEEASIHPVNGEELAWVVKMVFEMLDREDDNFERAGFCGSFWRG